MAVSGGPDSLALMLLAHACLGESVAVATVDHGLRADSAAEAATVHALCNTLGMAHDTLSVRLRPGNVQERARQARYDALGEWAHGRGLVAVLTAHHADDQAETFLMRLNRGSGVHGLASIRTASRVGLSEVMAVRPLLDWRKAELEAIVAQAGLVAARDPSNDDVRFDRTRTRAALADADWLDPLAIARSAHHLAEAARTIDWIVGAVWDREVETGGDTCRWRQSEQPDLVKLGLVERGIVFCGGGWVAVSDVARLCETIGQEGRANVAGVLVDYRGGVWSFRPEPPRR